MLIAGVFILGFATCGWLVLLDEWVARRMVDRIREVPVRGD